MHKPIYWPELKFPPINLWNAPRIRIRESARTRAPSTNLRTVDHHTLRRLLAQRS